MKITKTDVRSIDQYLRGFPKEVKIVLSEMRSAIRSAAPYATEKISYRIATFYYHGNLVHFAAFKNPIGLYPTSSGINRFKKQLNPYKTLIGTVQIPIDQPLSLKLIKKIVAFRVKENVKKKTRAK